MFNGPSFQPEIAEVLLCGMRLDCKIKDLLEKHEQHLEIMWAVKKMEYGSASGLLHKSVCVCVYTHTVHVAG